MHAKTYERNSKPKQKHRLGTVSKNITGVCVCRSVIKLLVCMCGVCGGGGRGGGGGSAVKSIYL